MKVNLFRKLFFSLFLIFCAGGSSLLAASAGPDLHKAKKESEAKGFIFEANHDVIVAKAKNEGALRVLTSLNPDTFREMAKAFRQKYPFIDIYVEEITGTEAAQRFMLELNAGTVKDWDSFHLFADFYDQYAAHAKKFDILGMARLGVLSIPTGMIDPNNRNIVAESSGISVIAYNKRLMSQERVPNQWEDFLKPGLKGKKFLVDIRPAGMAGLMVALGEEWVINYARRLKEQDPIWVRGHTRALAGMVSGEYDLFQLTNYNSCTRAFRKDLSKSLVCKVIEPVSVRLLEPEAALNTARHPYAALLWLEFQANPGGQRIIDEHEPLNSSIYAPGSEIERATSGKKVSINSWDTYNLTSRRMGKIVEAFGFPKVEERRK